MNWNWKLPIFIESFFAVYKLQYSILILDSNRLKMISFCHWCVMSHICSLTHTHLFTLFTGGAFEGVVDDVVSPFGYKRGEGIDAGFGELDWICDRDRARTDPLFEALGPIDGKISGAGKILYNWTTNAITIKWHYFCFFICFHTCSCEIGID